MNHTQPRNSILIVDDTPQNLSVLTQMLSQQGYRIRPAINGPLAIKATQKAPPDLILLDVMMPGMDGYEVCRRLKQDPATRDIPIIFISALHELGNKMKAFQAGGVDYITKPFQTAEVIARVQTHLKISRMQKQLQDRNARLQQEVAERTRTEHQLRKLSRAVEQSASTIVITDTQGVIEFANPAFSRISGYPLTEAIGKTPRLVSSGKHSPAFYQELWKTISRGDVWYGEFINKRKNGELYWESASISPVKNPHGQITHYVAVKQDITARKQAEDFLYKLQKAVETTEAGITITDPQGTIVYINPADASMHGYAVEELIGQRSNIFAPPESRKESGVLREEGELFLNWKRERLNSRKDGSVFPAMLISNPIHDKTGEWIGNVIVCEDITERKKTEKILRDQAILLRGVAGAMNRLLIRGDLDASLAESLEVLGFATGVDRIYMYETSRHPDTGAHLMSQRLTWAQDLSEVRINDPVRQNIPYQQGFQRWYDTFSQNKILSGLVRDFPLEERRALEYQDTISTLLVPITIRQDFWGFIGFDNCQTERQWNQEEEAILLAMAGSIGGAIARQQAEDQLIAANTELKQTLDHLQRTQHQLVLSEKMAALGQLIAGVAHEINTPLGAIRSSIQTVSTTLTGTLEKLPAFFQSLSNEHRHLFFALLKRAQQRDMTLSIKEERHIKRSLNRTLQAHQVHNARKMSELLVNIGVYDTIEPFLPLFNDPVHPRILDMAYRLAGLQESTRTIMTATDRASKVVFALKTYARYNHSGEMVSADILEGIETVLTLYHNQLKHGVEVVRQYDDIQPIRCYPDELNQVWTNLIHNALQAMNNKGRLTIAVSRHDRHIMVAVTDTGTGIPAQIKEHIFDPFFTTKPAGEGSGLGLDIVKKIVEKHRGAISFESQPGCTTFSVRLPF